MKLADINAKRFWAKVERSDGCWEWLGGHSANGYGMFWVNAAKNNRQAHVIAYMLANQVEQPVLFCCHTCDNPGCVNPHHIFLGTAQDNMRDKITKGRGGWLFGERHPCSKTTSSQVKNMHEMWAAGHSQTTIASMFGLHQSTVSYIVSGKTRKQG